LDGIIQPFNINALIAFFITLACLFVSAFVSASEVAFFSLSPKDFEKMENDDNPKDEKIKQLLQKPEHLLATILITNNLVNVSIIVLSSYIINQTLDFSAFPIIGFIFETILITFIILLVSEIMPKIFAQQHSLRMARFGVNILKSARSILKPFVWILVSSTSVVNKRLAKHKHGNNLSMDELSQALELTSDAIQEDTDILKGIVNFGNLTAAGVMTSRLDMVTLNFSATFDEVIDCIVEHEYSRIPVLQGSIDNVRGVLYAKDLIPHINKGPFFKWQTLIRQPYFVPETMKLDDLLQEFQKNKIHIAVVVDEFGGTSGMVTMEDVLEEVVGEISDEYDVDNSLYTKQNDGSYIFEAKIMLTDFFRATDIDAEEFEDITEEVDTLAGLLLELKGDFPKQNEEIEYKNYKFKVIAINARRILKVKLNIMKNE
jgi:gliding motility-associated protein GldE